MMMDKRLCKAHVTNANANGKVFAAEAQAWGGDCKEYLTWGFTKRTCGCLEDAWLSIYDVFWTCGFWLDISFLAMRFDLI